ncbi:hypothetical protein N9S47_01590 [Flavobacteriaceae bacterium]|jgi:hypothetical protein|nr:hypothetical protein [Flavobacteriaceae bacterium]
MKKLLIILMFVPLVSFGQKDKQVKSPKVNPTTKKIELTEKGKKSRYRRTINYNAANLWDAIRPVIGANVYFKDGKALINTGAFFPTGKNYLIWVVNGVILGEQIPDNININEIDKVTLLRSPMETEKYGFRGSAGVIEIDLK